MDDERRNSSRIQTAKGSSAGLPQREMNVSGVMDHELRRVMAQRRKHQSPQVTPPHGESMLTTITSAAAAAAAATAAAGNTVEARVKGAAGTRFCWQRVEGNLARVGVRGVPNV
mmetsp:Transcript_15151/g.27972  ORF Transcript_15151/g.27972 Transcript_15151/m.27972 type:complete len:114 (-) Transcript_15151:83-424(-)